MGCQVPLTYCCKTASYSCVRCVSHETCGGSRCIIAEERDIGKGFLCGVKSSQGIIVLVDGLRLWLGGSEKNMEGLDQVGAVREKSVIEVHEANELTQLALSLGLGKVTNGLNFLG